MATAMQRAIHRPLRADAGPRVGIVQRRAQREDRRVVIAAFDRDGALRGCGQPLRCVQSRADAGVEPEALQAGAGQHDGVVVPAIEFRQPRVDVAAQVQQLQVGPQRAQLRLPTQRRRADARALRQRFDAIETVADEGIGMVGAGQDRRQREARLQFHRHVLQRVHRAIRVAALHRQFQFLEEQALAADRRQRTIQDFIAARAHGHQFDDQAGMRRAQSVGDVFRLPEGKRALAGSDAQRGHARIIAGCLAGSWLLGQPPVVAVRT